MFDALAKANINVDMILQSIGRDNSKDISFTIPRDMTDDALKALDEKKDVLGAQDIKCKTTVAKVSIVGVYYPNNADTRHIINVQMRHASDMCEDANVRHEMIPLTVHKDYVQTLLNHAHELDSNLIVIMREESETDFTSSSNMTEILSTSKMPLLIIPNIQSAGLGR